MAGSPKWKIYTASGEYVAACKYAEDAAALVAVLGEGAQIKYDHRTTVFIEPGYGAAEGHPFPSAGESYDEVAEICHRNAGLTEAAR